MARVRTHYDPISLVGVFSGKYYTEITDRNGVSVAARGFTPQEARLNAEDRYDDKLRERKLRDR